MDAWNGDNWRWHRWSAARHAPQASISVIEPAAVEKPPPSNARRVPFGFARVLEPELVEREPLTWEGED